MIEKRMGMKGKIIVIEGTDCSGKETQSILLEKKLNELKGHQYCSIALQSMWVGETRTGDYWVEIIEDRVRERERE